MQGRRLSDCRLGDLPDGCDEPGSYWKYMCDDGSPINAVNEPGNLTGTMWGFCSPRGGIGTLRIHTVREHEDGTISVRPGDGSSNSIFFDQNGPQSWHGYIEHGVWTKC